jgi:hypothetical protein
MDSDGIAAEEGLSRKAIWGNVPSDIKNKIKGD